VPTLIVDGSHDIDETERIVTTHFEDALDTWPRASALTERRALLREANLAVVDQVHGYYERPWSQGDPGAVVRPFQCECGDPSCLDIVDAPVAGVETAPVLSPRHAGG
jgi:hypothetical protein